ncbi:MAG: FecR domain-containing protein [Bacteroidia bacterium]
MEDSKDSHLDDALLGRYLAGDCSPEEAREVDSWAAQSPENQALLDDLRAVWDSAEPGEETTVDVDNAWSRVQSRVQAHEDKQLRRRIRRSPSMWFIRIAAGIFVVFCVGLVLVLNRYNRPAQAKLLAIESGAQSLTDTLPDGTVITLNRNSRLEYPEQFSGDLRLVSLKGEAYFDVAHDAAHPFRILAGEAQVTVLGTSFNLDARTERVSVAVQTGKVELAAVDSSAGQRLLLQAGAAGTYDAAKNVVRLDTVQVENAAFWKTQRLVFEGEQLQDVVAELNAALGDSIRILSPEVGGCPLNTSFERPTIASALGVLKATFGLEVNRNGKYYEITGGACQ